MCENDNFKAFLWTESEAVLKQNKQVGPSGCGATSILNILDALIYKYDYETVVSQVRINKRIAESEAEVTTLAQYLFSRSVAGMNALELIENIERVTSSKISGRFFPFYPPSDLSILNWLSYWIRKGAVPVALLNLQKTAYSGVIPDAWHHQMIYGCDKNGVYLTNPLEIKSVTEIMRELTSESILLVRRIDVIKRFYANECDLNELVELTNMKEENKEKWLKMDVLAQCKNALDFNNENLTHIQIPASYVPGITLFFYTDSQLYEEILKAN